MRHDKGKKDDVMEARGLSGGWLRSPVEINHWCFSTSLQTDAVLLDPVPEGLPTDAELTGSG